MFVLYEMTRDIRIDPVNLNLDRKDAITHEINKQIANRVMLNVGLCICLWDIKSIGAGIIYPGDGGVTSKVNFRFVVFRPFQDEIIVGKIKNCTPEGVKVTLGFFDDILITKDSLQYPSRFEEREQSWVWEYEVGDDKHDMYMEKGESIRFKVTSELFEDTTSIPLVENIAQNVPTSGNAQIPSKSTPSKGGNAEENEPIITANKTPYRIVGSINEQGLGLLSWWR